MTLELFLRSINVPESCIITIPKEKLRMEVTVGIDDGMGYTPTGFHEIDGAYVDKDDNSIKIWI